MKYAQKILFLVVFIALIYACGTRKDSFTRRNYQAITTKYNVLFNGKEAFEKGVKGIEDNYKDDWFERLPIEPLDFDEDVFIVPTSNNNIGAGFNNTNNKQDQKKLTTFERAEQKAIKAIQKHSMNINGVERNRQIDDAYLLLGKARYYQQRYIPAIEAFNYVISSYPDADLINETKIWRAKANTRNDNEDVAIEAMKFLLVIKDTLERDLPNDIKEKGYTALAMAYVRSDSLQKAKDALHKATRTLDNRSQGARNLFILGQIYAEEEKKDSARMMFNRIIRFNKAPYKYKIHANIELARNSDADSTRTLVLKTLNKLIKNRDNRPYLDELYYQRAVLHQKNDSTALAIEDYNNSLRAKNGSEKQKTFTYEKLGNLYFKNSEYLAASAYYDSVLNLSKDSLDLRIRRVKRKNKNLASLIKFEKTIAVNDSILRIASLSAEEQKSFFEDYVAELKKADEEAAQLRLNQLNFGNNGGGLQSGKGKWYFYNSQSINFGKTEFQKVWGNRKLEDDWRWSSKTTTSKTEKGPETVTENTRYNVNEYLKTIPSEKSEIDSLTFSRNQALYELGLIYKEQFKNNDLAKERLERVYDLEPAKELILPINWHLYQLYDSEGNTAKANEYKNNIITNYPETKFAKIIQNPDADLTEKEVEISDIEEKYKEFYYAYKENKFEEVVKNIDELLPNIEESELLPKFELLKAYAIGKYQDKEAYKEALKFVSVNYGNTNEGKKAKEVLVILEK